MASSSPRVPGVVAIVTDRSGGGYEGAAGKRMLARRRHKNLVSAVFSTTKQLRTAVDAMCQEDKLNLDAPAKNYAPDIGKLQVLNQCDPAGEPKLGR